MKKIILIAVSAIIATFIYYFYVPDHFLSFQKHPQTEERLRERYDDWVQYNKTHRSGKLWEMLTRRLQRHESKMKKMMEDRSSDKKNENQKDLNHTVEKIKIDGDQAKVFAYSYNDKKSSGVVELWIYEDNDWYRDRAPSEWTMEWYKEKMMQRMKTRMK